MAMQALLPRLNPLRYDLCQGLSKAFALMCPYFDRHRHRCHYRDHWQVASGGRNDTKRKKQIPNADPKKT